MGAILVANDCFIKNWFRKNKSWLCFVFKLACIWLGLIILLMIIKYYYFGLSLIDYDKVRISLNNMLTLGATISATAFAWKQIEINQHTAKIELAIRYKDHYVKLVKALRNFINCHAEFSEEIPLNVQKLAWIELIDVTLEGQLIFDVDIQNLNQEIQAHANGVFQSKQKMKAKKAPLNDMQKAREEYWAAYYSLTGAAYKKSMFDQATELYKKNTAILTRNQLNER
jgi:hypothetical protein